MTYHAKSEATKSLRVLDNLEAALGKRQYSNGAGLKRHLA